MKIRGFDNWLTNEPGLEPETVDLVFTVKVTLATDDADPDDPHAHKHKALKQAQDILEKALATNGDVCDWSVEGDIA
jgi:hypothetical protein